MKERCLNAVYPSMEWLSYGFSMISLDQGRTVTAPPKQGSIAVTGQVSRDVVSQPLSGIQRRLVALAHRNAVPEPSSRQALLNQRQKDRRFRVAAFSNKAAQYHAADLFDIETCAMDVSESVKGLAPSLVLQVCQPLPANASKAGVLGEPTNCSTLGDQITPLLEKLGKLHCLVDNRIHLQQVAGTTMVGYNAYYNYKLAQHDGLAKYSCSRADKEFLAQDQRETEKAILHLKLTKSIYIQYPEVRGTLVAHQLEMLVVMEIP